VNRALSTDGMQNPRAFVRSAIDMDRLVIHLFTHLKLPRIEIRIDTLPSLVVQRAQHKLQHLSNSCNCVLAIALACLALLVGAGYVWTYSMAASAMLMVAISGLYAGLIGKGLDIVWTRLRMMRVLHRLRDQLVAGRAFDAEAAQYKGVHAPKLSTATPAAATVADAERDADILHSLAPARAARPRVLLHNAADINRLILHLFTHWTVPRVEISVDGAAALHVQRAQNRIVRLSEACNCVLGGTLAAITLLGGTFYVQWSATQNWDWMIGASWGPLALVPVAAVAAAAIGWVIEATWNRARLMLVLNGLRRRMGR
jgi:hypothetical protein